MPPALMKQQESAYNLDPLYSQTPPLLPWLSVSPASQLFIYRLPRYGNVDQAFCLGEVCFLQENQFSFCPYLTTQAGGGGDQNIGMSFAT